MLEKGLDNWDQDGTVYGHRQGFLISGTNEMCFFIILSFVIWTIILDRMGRTLE